MRNLNVSLIAVLSLAIGKAGFAETAPVPFRADVEKLAKENSDFRHVLFTSSHVQIVAMSLPPNEDIGAEVHVVDQCFFFVEGEGQAVVAGKISVVKENEVLCVPAGMRHDVHNTGKKPLKLYTLYSPPQHPPGTVHHTKQDAQRSEGKTEGSSPH
jgi:mannose-6-phosphate isomerase-like protein (cupin superfamily)